jgi:hypothetical protein
MVSDAQVRKMMQEYGKDQNLTRAALRSDMDRKTARKFRDLGELPSKSKTPRGWRTRKNPFEMDWDEVVDFLEGAPDIEVLTIFDYLCEKSPGRYQRNQLRTLQRHVRRYRAQQGPEKTVFFGQEHRPGEAFQTDWTHADELRITIGGEDFAHLICHVMLPFSNWEWGTICESESFLSLRSALRATVLRLGFVAAYHQTDSSSAATHKVKSGRDFNDDYSKLMNYYGMQPRRTKIGAKEQNGDVESSHHHLKRRLKQRLILRGHRDFESLAAYQQWLEQAFDAFNAERNKKLEIERAHMTRFDKAPMPVYLEKHPKVTKGSTIHLYSRVYSVPSRLIGHTVRVRLFDRHIEVDHDGVLQLQCERLRGSKNSRIDYRHIIWSLVRKPGAFARYRFREEMFPSVVFRQAYDDLSSSGNLRHGDLEYLRILQLAADGNERNVELALRLRLESGASISFDELRDDLRPKSPRSPLMLPLEVDLSSYDELCQGVTA